MCNTSKLDRIIRVVAGLALGAFAWFVLGLDEARTVGVIAGVIAAILVITGLVGFCPAYRLFGINTCKVGNSDNEKQSHPG